jgi:hypothetical protein
MLRLICNVRLCALVSKIKNIQNYQLSILSSPFPVSPHTSCSPLRSLQESQGKTDRLFVSSLSVAVASCRDIPAFESSFKFKDSFLADRKKGGVCVCVWKEGVFILVILDCGYTALFTYGKCTQGARIGSSSLI